MFGIRFLRLLTIYYHLPTFVSVCLGYVFLAFVLLSVAVVCSRSLLFVFACFLALLRWFASFDVGQWGHSRIGGSFMR